MCVSVLVNDVEISSVLTLSQALGVPVKLLPGCDWEVITDECLCNCDIESMAKDANKEITDVSNDWDNYAFIDYLINDRKQIS